ncbi:hypothetical protein ANO14919_109840 [Xylariales sp. No.14919]|nr:hypothetical protein ANO14919_109840 [Xylariales sp. No.14919]
MANANQATFAAREVPQFHLRPSSSSHPTHLTYSFTPINRVRPNPRPSNLLYRLPLG